jgi:hypothetical protein
MTRFLAEHCERAVCVEGSQRRAAIAASRCRDLSNVSVYCDNLLDFRTEEKFDYVLLIGVLEYATQYGSGEDPIADCLKHASSMLGEDGQLVVAIENQLGLKYFAGCAEDHHNIPFFGVSDLYRTHQATTYGRHALGNALHRAGLEWHEFYYPFPDYKLPTLMLSAQALMASKLNVADLLLTCPSRDYHDDRYRCFDEGLAWRALHRNGLLQDLANSFLVFAGNGNPRPVESWLCKSYNRTVRHQHLAIETTFTARDESIHVAKKHIFPESFPVGTYRNEPRDSTYLEGNLLLNAIREAMSRDDGFDEVAATYEPWISLLKRNSLAEDGGELTLPGNFIDCVPFNLMVDAITGELDYFDAEWASEDRIPLSWVFIRGAIYSVSGAMTNQNLAGLTHRRFLQRLADKHEILLDDRSMSFAAEKEADFYTRTSASVIATPDLIAIYDQLLFTRERYRATDDNEAARVKGTISWRITAPLRVLANACGRLVR